MAVVPGYFSVTCELEYVEQVYPWDNYYLDMRVGRPSWAGDIYADSNLTNGDSYYIGESLGSSNGALTIDVGTFDWSDGEQIVVGYRDQTKIFTETAAGTLPDLPDEPDIDPAIIAKFDAGAVGGTFTVYEFLVFDRALTEEEVLQWVEELQIKYGV